MKKFFMPLFFFAALTAALAWAEPELVVQEWHDGAPENLQFSADGAYLFSSKGDVIKIWDLKNGALLKNIEKLKKNDKNAAFAPSGLFCAYISKEGNLEAYNIATNKKTLIDSALDKKTNHTVTFSPDGTRLAVTTYNAINIYDAVTFKRINALQDDKFCHWNDIVFSADSKKLVATASIYSSSRTLGAVVIWNMSNSRVSAAIDIGEYLRHLTVSNNSKFIAVTSGMPKHEDIVICNLQSGKVANRAKLPSNDILNDLVMDLEFSPDGKNILALGVQRIYTFDVQSGKEISLDSNFVSSFASSIAFSPDGKEYAVNGYDSIEIYSYKSKALTKKMRGGSDISGGFFYNKKLNSIVLRTYNNASNNINVFRFDSSNMARSPEFSLTAERLLSVFDDGLIIKNGSSIFEYNFASGKTTALRNFTTEQYVSFFSNCDNNIIALLENKTVTVLNPQTNKIAASFKIENDSATDRFFSPQKRFLAAINAYYTNNNKTEIFDIAKQNKILLDQPRYMEFSPDDAYCAAVIRSAKNSENNVALYDTNTWQVAKTLPYHAYMPLCFSADGRYLLINIHNPSQTVMYDVIGEKEIRRFAYMNRAVFNADMSKIFAMTHDNILRTYSVATGELLTSTIANADGDWLTYTPEGYFNGSEGGINKFVHLVNGMEVTGLGQLAETLYRPDLVAEKLRGAASVQQGAGNAATVSALQQIVSSGEPPLVRFADIPSSSKSRDIEVSFTVQDAGGGVGAVYLSLNGKVIVLSEGSRKLQAASAAKPGGAQTTGASKPVQYTHLISLQNGENKIEAYATNAAGKIESRRARASVTWQGATQKPSLYVLSVGVNKYRDRSLWLQYSVPDAQSVSQIFSAQKSSLYQSVHTSEILDGDVTKENLSARFAELSAQVKPDDVFALFIAGHGTTSPETGDYYFIPANFRFTDSSALIEQGISKNDILDYMKNIRAQKSLIMLDTCNSGAFAGDKAARGWAEKSALERLVHATGQAVLTAASEEQSAMEGYNGHGIFTYVLLEALAGKADSNKDGYVSLNELASYIDLKVPELSYQKWGYEQVPMKELRKQDFPLVGK